MYLYSLHLQGITLYVMDTMELSAMCYPCYHRDHHRVIIIVMHIYPFSLLCNYMYPVCPQGVYTHCADVRMTGSNVHCIHSMWYSSIFGAEASCSCCWCAGSVLWSYTRLPPGSINSSPPFSFSATLFPHGLSLRS